MGQKSQKPKTEEIPSPEEVNQAIERLFGGDAVNFTLEIVNP